MWQRWTQSVQDSQTQLLPPSPRGPLAGTAVTCHHWSRSPFCPCLKIFERLCLFISILRDLANHYLAHSRPVMKLLNSPNFNRKQKQEKLGWSTRVSSSQAERSPNFRTKEAQPRLSDIWGLPFFSPNPLPHFGYNSCLMVREHAFI